MEAPRTGSGPESEVVTVARNLTLIDMAPEHFPVESVSPIPAEDADTHEWTPVPQMANIWFVGQRPHEIQRREYLPESLAHPGKMLPDLAALILATYVAPMRERLGRRPVVLDAMAGIGTTLVEAVKLDIDAIGVELEHRWADLARRNAEAVAARYRTGARAVVLQGDARDLPSVLQKAVDAGVTSPPYGPTLDHHRPEHTAERRRQRLLRAGYPLTRKVAGGASSVYNRSLGYDAGLISPPYGPAQTGGGIAKQGWYNDPGFVRRLYTPDNHSPVVDAGVTSPPYGDIRQDGGPHQFGDRAAMTNYSGEPRIQRARRKADNLGNLSYGTMDKAMEYLAHLKAGGPRLDTGGPGHEEAKARGWANYLCQMVPVYLGYRQVIRPGGVLAVVVRNFRRDRGEVDLSGDTIRLCEAAGFKFHHRIIAITSAVRLGEGGRPELAIRVSPFKRVNARRRTAEEGVAQLLEVFEEVLVFKA